MNELNQDSENFFSPENSKRFFQASPELLLGVKQACPWMQSWPCCVRAGLAAPPLDEEFTSLTV